MANSGIFRTSIFGGFNKNDVLKYFEDIKRDSADELEQLKVTNSELMSKMDELERVCAKAEKESQQLEEATQKLQTVSDENAMLKAQLEELTEKLKAADSHKSRAEQLMRAVVRTESENAALKNEVQQLKAITDCLDKLDFDALQREIALCADEKNKLEAELCKISDTLGSVNIAINAAKSRDEGLSKSLSALVNMVSAMKNTVNSAQNPQDQP